MEIVNKVRKNIAWIAGLVFSLFMVYSMGFGQFSPMVQRGVPLLLVCIIIFCTFPLSKKNTKSWHLIVDGILLIASVLTIGYVLIFENDILLRLGSANTTLDYIVSTIGILLVLETCRRTTGYVLVILGLIFFVYIFAGPYIPGFFGHTGFSFERSVAYIFLGYEGIFGVALNTMATVVAIFIIFGTILEVTGAGKYFIDLSLAVTGRLTGGPGITAILASSLFGTMSGSPVANVVGTGTLTIPLMKKSGFKKDYAGAIEAVASTGGQYLPPVMGSAAFVMAELLGISYLKIIVAAIIPALLFYFSVFLTVYLRAVKDGLKPMPKEEIPSIRKIFKDGGHMFIPIIVLVYLLMKGFSPGYAAFFTIVSAIVLSLVRKTTRRRFIDYVDSLIEGAKQNAGVFAALAVVGIIIGSISITGIGVKFSILVTNAAGESLFLALLFVAIATVILGMGLPPVACYLLVGVIAGSAISSLGLDLFTAHMFIFYFAGLAPITPPVAMSSYAAAGISGGSIMGTSFYAVRIGLLAFILPFMFAYAPELILVGDNILFDTIKVTITTIGGIILIAAAFEGYLFKVLPIWIRVLAFISGILCIIPETISDIIGMSALVLLLAYVFVSKNKTKVSENTQVTTDSI
jgi:TRAP transporter 4TM/12TM fusion protein